MKIRKSHNLNNRFDTNSKVVCINDNFSNLPPLYKLIFKFPRAEAVYSIRAIDRDGNIFLNEVINEIYKFPDGAVAEPSFLKWRFKPLDLIEIEDVVENQELQPVDSYLFAKANEDMDLQNWFSKLSDNQKLSLFLKRVNCDEATLYDDLLKKWWINRY